MKWIKWIIPLSFLVVWGIAATPYRFFPTDDWGRFWPYLTGAKLDSAFYEPVIGFGLKWFGAACHWLTIPTPTCLIVVALLCYAGTMILLGMIGSELFKKSWIATIPVLIFATAAWPVQYLFFWSYACVASLFSVAALYFIIKNKTVYSSISALCCLLSIGVSLSGILVVAGMLVFLLFANRNEKERLRSIIAVALILATGAALLYFTCGKQYAAHLASGQTDQYQLTISRFGYIPKTPLTGLFVLFTYSKLLTLIFIIATAISLWGNDKIIKVFCASVWIQILVVQVLTANKVGRHHFCWFPTLCILVGLVIRWLSDRKRMKLLSVIFVAGAVTEGMICCHSIWEMHTALPSRIKALHARNVFLLPSDPHAMFLELYLSEFKPQRLTSSAVPRSSLPAVIVAGPSGLNSGISILRAGCLPDFKFDCHSIPFPVEYVPWYAYSKYCLLEEEMCMGLYFAGKTPNPKDNEKMVKLYIVK